MRVVAVVLTYNAVKHGRVDLLRSTVGSLAAADEVAVIDNGSDDGSDLVEVVGASSRITHKYPSHTSGLGTNLCGGYASRRGDLCIVSDDDVYWRPGWRGRLEAWWTAAPESLILTGCHLEPLFPWNEPYGTVEHGGLRGLLRASTGAATWSFRAADWPKIGPIPARIQGWGDVPACHRVRAQGHDIAQVDLAEHRGHGRSTWGNTTIDGFGWDLTPVHALLREVSCASA